MIINDYAKEVFTKTGELISITTTDGNRLSLIQPIPGYAGFGLNRASKEIIINGRLASIKCLSSNDLGYSEFIWS